MRTKRFDGSDLRFVLIGMITNQVTLARITGQWTNDGLFDAQWANLIGSWCVKYFKKYGTTPGVRIGRLFEKWADDSNADEKTVEAVERFLQTLSDEHEDNPPELILDVAGSYFNKVRLEKEIQAAQIEIESGNVQTAQNRLQRIAKINLGVGSYVDVGSDPEAWLRAFERDRTKPLVCYHGPLGEFTQNDFNRGSFYSFLAPDKVGKTTWLVDFAYQAVRQRNRVAFFDTGDSNENEIITRLACRSSMRPEWPQTIDYPSGWDDQGLIRVEVPYEAAEAMDSYWKFRKICVAGDLMRISCHRNSSVSIMDIDSILTDWDRAGWRPDVVVLDYMDILANPKGTKDKIEAIDETWKYARRITQDRHVLLLTATQTKSTGYGKTDGLLTKEDFSGSKSKNAHVNGILCINVSSKDKEQGLSRISWAARRRGYFNDQDYCLVAGSMALGAPHIVSKKTWGLDNNGKK